MPAMEAEVAGRSLVSLVASLILFLFFSVKIVLILRLLPLFFLIIRKNFVGASKPTGKLLF